MSRSETLKAEYAELQRFYETLLDGSEVATALESGTLPHSKVQNIIHQYWQIVSSFPDYLGILSERMATGNRLEKAAKTWVDMNITEEGNHKEMWYRLAEESGVSRESLDGLIPNNAIKTLHERLVYSAKESEIPYALGDISVAIEGITGVATRRFHKGILRIHESSMGKSLSESGGAWLDVHDELDYDKHPLQAFGLITRLHSDCKQVLDSVRNVARLYVAALDVSGSQPYKPS
jgi:pyrroloquinoline quinone (PQQ) biosynthesis protein C